MFTEQIPIQPLLLDSDILKSMLAPIWIETETPNLSVLGLQNCVNGNPIKNNEKYEQKFALTIALETLHFQLIYSETYEFRIQAGDWSNLYQYTFESNPNCQFGATYVPPFGIQWWNLRYPNDHTDSEKFQLYLSYILFLGYTSCWK